MEIHCFDQELLIEWMKLEHAHYIDNPSEFADSLNELLVLARDGRQLVDFVTTVESLVRWCSSLKESLL